MSRTTDFCAHGDAPETCGCSMFCGNAVDPCAGCEYAVILSEAEWARILAPSKDGN